MKEIRQIIKHSGATHIENKITLAQRQAWNVMAEKARPNIDKQLMHEIRLAELMRYLNFNSHNQDYLKETLRALVGCVVEWNILGKDKINIWGAMTMLSQVMIQEGKVFYAFPPELSDRLKQTNMYAKLDLQIQNRIDSKYGQALWELCVDAFDQSRGAGETPAIPLETFRKLMGVPETAYLEFKKLNACVIHEAMKVVNGVTDFEVVAEFKRQNRKVTSIKFRITNVPGKGKNVPQQQYLFPEDKDQPNVVRELKHAGIDSAEAWKIYQQGFAYIEPSHRPDITRYDADPERAMEKYVREKIELTRHRLAEGKVKSTAGFLRQAIRKNFENPESGLAAQLSEQKRRAKEVGQMKRRQDTLTYQREQLGRDRDVALHQACKVMVEEKPELLDATIADLCATTESFRKNYPQTKPVMENYERPLVYVFVDKWLEEKYPERFEGIRAEFMRKTAAIDQAIATLAQSCQTAA